MSTQSGDGVGWRPLVPIAMVMFIIALDTTMLNVAIPSIVEDLGTTTSAVQSAVALYSLVMAALMVGFGMIYLRFIAQREFKEVF